MLLVVLAATAARAGSVTIDLPTGTKLQAEFALPAGGGRVPAVIYLHAASVRDVGPAGAAERGHDIAAFARAFAEAGFAAIVPVRKTPMDGANGDAVIDEGLAAILGAMDALRIRPEVDPERIAVAGYGEGGLIALWAAARMPDIGAAIIVSPNRMAVGRSAARTMTFGEFLRPETVAAIRAPVLLIQGERESRTARRTGDELTGALMESYKRFRYIRAYPGDRRWFAAPQPDYMSDIVAFLSERLYAGR